MAAPGTVYDLTACKLTLPTDGADGGTDADEISQASLPAYDNASYFTLDGSNRMVMTAPVQGATTSGSGGTRCELREMEAGAEAAWAMSSSAPRQLTVTGIFNPTSITDREEMIVGQIHGTTGTPPLYLSVDHSVATPRLRIFKDGPGLANLLTGLTSTTKITYRIRVGSGRVQLYGAIGDVADLPALPQYDWAAGEFTDNTGCYFKAGAYNKSTVADGGTGSAIATISHFELLQNIQPIGQARLRDTGGAAATTSHTVAMPSGVVAGDRLLVGFVSNTATATASTSSTGWTALGTQAQGTTTNHRLTVFTKVATGSDTLTVALSASQAARWNTMCMRGNGGTPTVQFANGGSATSGSVTAQTGLALGDYTSAIFLGLDNSVALAHTVTAPAGWGVATTSGTGTDPVFSAETDLDLTAVTGASPSSVSWTNAEQWITAHVIIPTAAATGARIPTRRCSRRLAALLDM